MLTIQDFRDILDITLLSASSVEHFGMREEILSDIQRTFKANRAMYLSCKEGCSKIDFAKPLASNMGQLYVDRYTQYYWRIDPCLPVILRSGDVVIRSSDVVPDQLLMTLEFYNDYHKPQDIYYELDICLRSDDNLLGIITLLRSKQEANFDDGDMLKAEMLSPQITASVRNARFYSRIVESRDLLQVANETLPEGMILLDNELKPVFCNSEASRLSLYLSNGVAKPACGLDLGELPIPPQIMENCLALKRLFEEGCKHTFIPRPRIIYGKNNRKLYTEYFVVGQFSQRPPMPYILVRLKELYNMRQAREEIIIRKYSLTMREIEIVRLASNGLSSKEIAKSLFISKFTVHSHLRNIFEKTGAKSRLALANLIQSATEQSDWPVPQ